jgi:hypothetical protein
MIKLDPTRLSREDMKAFEDLIDKIRTWHMSFGETKLSPEDLKALDHLTAKIIKLNTGPFTVGP